MHSDEISSFASFGDAPVFVFCDHASNAIPPDLNQLGLPDDILQTHVAWDIGAAAVGNRVAKYLGGSFLRNEFSRLVVDPNRSPDASDSIPSVSDQIPIPGNQMLGKEDCADRVHRFHTPYHRRFAEALDKVCASGDPPFVASIHTYTKRLMGAAEDRPWPIGLLWRDDPDTARLVKRALETGTGWLIGDNEPYDARIFNYTVDRHIGPRGLRHVTIEVRQDLVGSDEGAELVAGHLCKAFETAMKQQLN
ncbi:MAG: N-formylglutamate amidohydrolase [Pseudomonadota bacterium]